MPNYDRDEIRSIIIKRYANKLKKTVLDKNIEGLVDEFIEKREFVRKNGKSIDDFPTKTDIKWWFQDKVSDHNIETTPGEFEDALEINVDEICLDDPIATQVFKSLYRYTWKSGDEIDPVIKNLIKLTKIADASKSGAAKKKLRYRLNNIAIVGVIRFYHLERKPYLCVSQINTAINFFRNALLIIDKIDGGEYKDETILGEVSIFEAFKDGDLN